MKKIFKSILVAIVGCCGIQCTSDKYSEIEIPDPNALVPIRIGSSWVFYRTSYEFPNEPPLEYRMTADYSVEMDHETWYHMKLSGLWDIKEYYWKCDDSGFYEKRVYPGFPSDFEQVYFYPSFFGANSYQIVTPPVTIGDTLCHAHNLFSVHKESCDVYGIRYDAYKYAFDTAFASGNCTGVVLFLTEPIVHFFTKGIGCVKKVEYDFFYINDLLNAPDSAMTWKDELIRFDY